MEYHNVRKPEVIVEDVLTAAADALVIIPGVSLGGEDLSAQIMKKAGVALPPHCEQGRAIILPAGQLNASWLIIGKATALGDDANNGITEYIEAIKACLELARSVSADSVAFSLFPTDRYDSRLFTILTSVWRAVINSQRDFGSPSLVRSVCQNNEIARYYRVVYNY